MDRHTPQQVDAGWLLVHRQLSRARESLAEARDVEQYQAIGVLCRETLISLAQAVYQPSRHKTLDGVQASKTDGKRMLEAYIATELPGETNRYARAAATSALALALDLQHSRSGDKALAAMTVEQTASVVALVSITAKKTELRATLAVLIERYSAAQIPSRPLPSTYKKTANSQTYLLRRLAASPLGSIPAAELQTQQVIAYANELRQKVKPSTVRSYIAYLRQVLAHARDELHLSVTTQPVDEAKRILFVNGTISKPEERTVVATKADLDRLQRYFIDIETGAEPRHGVRPTILLSELHEFALWSGRRIGEICRLQWEDVDLKKGNCVVRGLIAPSTKQEWDHPFPLLGRALEIVKARDAAGRTSARIFPYNAKSASQAYARAKRALGLKHLRMQDLRRLTGAFLLEQGYSLHQVIAVLGRVDTRPVMKELGLTAKPDNPTPPRHVRG